MKKRTKTRKSCGGDSGGGGGGGGVGGYEYEFLNNTCSDKS